MPESDDAVWWRRIGRTADVLQILGWLGLPTLAAIIGVLIVASTDDANEAQTTSPPLSTDTRPEERAGTKSSSATPSESASDLLVTFSVDSTYSLGKDKAGACETIQVHCLGLDATVLADGHDVRSGCHLWWELYEGTSSDLFEKGLRECHQTIWIGRNPMAAGDWRLEVNVELDDGTTGSSTYEFALVDTYIAPEISVRSDLLVTFSVDSTYSLGKDKAGACETIQVHCLGLDATVFADSGEIRSGCHLWWELYESTSLDLFEKGLRECHQTIWIGRNPMAAGDWRLEVNVELDDGTTGSSTYEFTLVDR